MNYEQLFKRLLVMNHRGVYLRGADGHIWIWEDENCEYRYNFKNVSLNSKIYGGIAQAIDTFDAAVQRAGYPSLMDEYNQWGDDVLFIGKSGIAESRIDIVGNGRGGIN